MILRLGMVLGGALVVIGACLADVAAGLMIGGFVVAGLTALFFVEV